MEDQESGQQAQSRNFNPNKHLVQIKSKVGSSDYLPVKWRIAWFRAVHPHGTIDTQEMCIDLNREVEAEAYIWNAEKRRSEKVIKQAKGYARFRAIVTDGKGGRATGTKAENAANFADYVEKSETGAIGRALAALGFGTQFTDQEFEEGERIVDAPVERQQQRSSNQEPADDAEATEPQLNAIRQLSAKLDKDEPASPTSFLAAKKLIQQLTAEVKEAQQKKKVS